MMIVLGFSIQRRPLLGVMIPHRQLRADGRATSGLRIDGQIAVQGNDPFAKIEQAKVRRAVGMAGNIDGPGAGEAFGLRIAGGPGHEQGDHNHRMQRPAIGGFGRVEFPLSRVR